MSAEQRYDAFISYSHAVDGPLAAALRKAPQQFAKPWNRWRALRVFLDSDSLEQRPVSVTPLRTGTPELVT